jgi:hypothetical protein
MLQGCGFGISSFSLGRNSTGTSLAEEEATGSGADPRPTNVSVRKSNPLEAYIAVGGTIKRCWFNATDPLLPNQCLSRRRQPRRQQSRNYGAPAG